MATSPPHRLAAAGVYFVTSRTLDRTLYFREPERLTFVRDHLFALAAKYHWRLEAWAVLANHYHLVAHSPTSEATAATLRTMLTNFHADVTRHFNRLDGTPGRKIWHNYRETHLTFQRSYLARLNYTHNNPVHHRLVPQAERLRMVLRPGF